MRALSFLFVSSVAVLFAGIGCDDETGDGPVGGAGDAGRGGGDGVGPGGTAGTSGSGGGGGSDEPDAEAPYAEPDAAIDADPANCELSRQAFASFLAANRDCDEDSDCSVIGDCGPNADWRAVNAEAAAEGYALMQARCSAGTFDGPEYAARCDDGQCVLGEEVGVCGGPPDDGGVSADASSSSDASAGDGG
jgi:hypothetical protein